MKSRSCYSMMGLALAWAVAGINGGWESAAQGAPADHGGQPGTPGWAQRQDTVSWETLTQGTAEAPAASRVSRKHGQWVRGSAAAAVPMGALGSADLQSAETEPLFSLAGATPPSPAPGISFAGVLDDGTRFNPDTQGAVGPNHLMVTAGNQMRVQDRLGNTVSTVTLNQFWSGMGSFQVYDPRLLYDRTSQRWIHVASANPGETNAALLIAVSQTSTPTGNWNRHVIGLGNTNRIFPDSPNVGLNKNWISVQANMFDSTNFNFFSSDIWAFGKTNLYNGVAATYRHFRYRSEGLGPVNAQVPAVTYDDTMGTNFLVSTWLGNYDDPVAGPIGLLRLYSIGGPVDAPVLNDFGPSGLFIFGSAAIYNPPWADYDPYGENFAPQLGTTNKIYIGDARIQNVVYRNSTLWCAHHVFLPYSNPTRSAVQWFASTPGGTVLQRGRVDDATGARYFAYPSIAVNQFEDVLLGYTRFAANQYPSANYSFHSFEDFPGSLRGDAVLKAGEGKFSVDDRGITRWGDWSSTVVDPNNIDLWTLQEYGAAPSGGQDRWGTWWGVFSPPTGLTLTMTSSTNRVLATATVTYSLRVTNTTAQPATGVRIVDTLPAGAAFVTATASQGGCSQAGGVVTCDVGTLAGVNSMTATIVARLNDSGTATNRATVSAYGPDTTPSDNTVTVLTTVDPASDLSVTATDSPDPVAINSTLTYLVGVSNAGPSAAGFVFLTNTIPAGVTFVSATTPQGSCSRNGNVVTCNLGTIVPLSAIPVTIRVTPTIGGQLTNKAVVTSGAVELAAGNNSISIVTRANGAPTLTTITGQTILEDVPTAALPVTIGDAETPAANLNLGAFSSVPALVPPGNITFTGSGSAWNITVRPALNANGTATIFYYVSDADGASTTNSFVLTVTPVNDFPTISDVLPQTISEDTTLAPITFTIGDVETPAGSLSVSATSSNPGLVPGSSIQLVGTDNTRTVSLTPATNLFGTTTITIFVSDGVNTTNDTFVLTVNSVNDVPTVTPLGAQVINEDADTGAISFSIGDVETATTSLNLIGSSSNPTIVPISGIVFGGSAGSRTVTVTPAPDQFGTVTITVNVSDGTSSTNTTLGLTINPVNDPPTLGALADIAINEDSGINPVTLTVVAAGPTNENQSISITATSSIPAIIAHPVVDYTDPATTGTLRLVPSTNAIGLVQITVTINDNAPSNNITTRVFSVNVLPVNDAPTLSSITDRTMAEDSTTGPIAITLSDVDNLADGLQLSATSTNAALVPSGSFAFDGAGTNRTIEIRPATNQFGRTLISVIASDGLASSTNSFVLDVTPVNDPPTITSIPAVLTPEDVATNVVITLDDDETAPGSLTVTASSSNPGVLPNGNIAVPPTGMPRTIALTPVANASGAATVTVMATDGGGLRSSNTFVVTVVPVNDPPTLAQIGDLTIAEDAGVQTVALTGLGSGAPDESQDLQVTATSDNTALIPNPTVNYLSPNPSGALAFTPVTNANGSATITVRVNDQQAVNSVFTRTFTVQVTPANDSPTVTVAGTATILEDGTTNLLVTLSDPDGDTAGLNVQVGSSNEELIDASGLDVSGIGGTRTLRVTPLPNQFGSATLTVNISDGQGGSDLKFINLTVTPVNDVPFISAITDLTIDKNSATADIPFTVSDEETFADNLRVSARSSNPALVPAAGIVLGGSGFDRTIRVTPALDQSGTAIITVEAVDEDAGTNSVTFRLRVRGENEPPTISLIPDQVTTENTATTPALFTIADNESPAGILQLAASSSNTGIVANASITLGGVGGNRSVYVMPATNRVGTTFITVTVTDPDGLVDTRTFRVTVLPVDHPPTISALTNISFAEDTLAVVDFVIGDDDSAPELLAVTATASDSTLIPAGGLTVTGVGANRSLTLQPALNQSGTSVVAVTVIDINGTTTNVSFVATVTPVNDRPTVSGVMPVTIDEDTSSGPLELVVGDVDTALGSLTVTAESQNQTLLPNSGLAPGGSGGLRTLTVSPAPNQSGSVTVAITVADGAGGSVISNLVVTINPINDPPTLTAPGNLVLNEDAGQQTVNLSGIGAGAGESQSLVVTAASSNPSVVPNPTVNYASPAATGSLQFTPVANATGTVTITVTVGDQQSVNGSVSRTFNVTLNPQNDAPILPAIAAQQTNEDVPLTVSFFLNDLDSVLGDLTLSATSTNTTLVPNANVAFSGAGTNRTLTILPTTNLFGTTLISVQASDGVQTSSNSFVLTVVSINDPPTLNPIPNYVTNSASGNPAHTITLTGIGTGAANESQSLTVAATSSNTGFLPNPIVVYTSPNPTATMTLRPGNNATGSAVVTVVVTDNGGGGNSSTQTFLVNVKSSGNVVPTMTSISNQTISEDGTTGDIPFTVRDAETAVGSLTISATSGNPGLIPNANIILSGSGANRFISVRPAPNASGTAPINMTIVDGAFGASNMTFTVTVTPVNDAPTISTIAAQSVVEDGVLGPVALTVGDLETPARDLALTATSSNPTVIPQANIRLGGVGAGRSITLTPAANVTGASTIQMVVSDGVANATNSFVVTVTATNDAPTISDIADQSTSEDTTLVDVAFTVGDLESAADALVPSVASSNPALVPTNNVTFGGNGSSRTLTILPATNQFGSATITVTVGDGVATATDTFVLTVSPVNDAPSLNTIADVTARPGGTPVIVSLAGISLGPPNENQSVLITASSSAPSIVPHPGVSYGSPAATGSLTVSAPTGASGSAVITVTASDGQAQNQSITQTFTVTVDQAPTISVIPGQVLDEDQSVSVVPFTVGDAETSLSSLTISVTAANSAILSTNGLVLGGTGADRELRLTPRPDAFGSTTVTVTVDDAAGNRATQIFPVTVRPINDRPTLDPLANREVAATAGSTGVALSGIRSGASNELQLLTVRATSSQPSIIPNPSIVYASPSETGTLTFTPTGTSGGSVVITVSVEDDGFDDGSGLNRVTQTFTVNVTGGNSVPPLTIDLVAGKAIVSWTTNGGNDLVLQGSANVVASTWNSVPIIPVVVNGRYTVTNTPSATDPIQFFRLCRGCGGPPTLTIRRDGSDVVVSWPMDGSVGYALQGSGTLGAASWSAVAGSPVVEGANHTVRVPAASGPRFFRLCRGCSN